MLDQETIDWINRQAQEMDWYSFWGMAWGEVVKLVHNETTLDELNNKGLDTNLLAGMCAYMFEYPSEREG